MLQDFSKTSSVMAEAQSSAQDYVQGSGAWHGARLGCVTASRVADVVAKTKSGYSASRQTYMGQLLSERLTGLPTETFQNAAMRWGTETEPEAVDAYEAATGIETCAIGFLYHPSLAYAGASPDRVIAPDGLLEVKCPTTATHIETLLKGEVQARYVIQMQWQMACADRDWCDFVSYDPRMPEAYQLYIQRVPRDAQQIRRLEEEVALFLEELEAKLDALQGISGFYQ